MSWFLNFSQVISPRAESHICTKQHGQHTRKGCTWCTAWADMQNSVFWWCICMTNLPTREQWFFSAEQFFRVIVVPYSLFKGNGLLAESSNIRCTQCFLYNCFSLPLPVVCTTSSLCACNFHFKNLLRISCSVEMHTCIQFTTRKQGCKSRTE